MQEMRFDGRTAIVTGAGGNPSLGRAFALALAARGANVVVNDIGRDDETPGYTGSASAESVVQEILAAGGKAVASTASVATEDGANAIIQTALDAFGSVDILVNNAGVSIAAGFDEMSLRDCLKHIEVNLVGTMLVTHAAWPHMRERGFGRIINISSGAISGMAQLAAYGASKGGIFALTRALAAEGAAIGIKVNTLNPGAFTRMLAAQQEETGVMYKLAQATQPAELVAPAIIVLAHDSCRVNGECLEACGGKVGRVVLAQTPGFEDRELTAETIVERWSDVMEGELSIIDVAPLDTSEWHIKAYRK